MASSSRLFVKFASANIDSPLSRSQRAHSASGVLRSVVRFPSRMNSSSAANVEFT